MKNKILLTCFTAEIICATSAPALARKKCQPHRPATSLKYEIEPVEYIRTLSAKQLSIFHSPFSQNTVLGLAGGQVGTRFEASFKIKEVSKNKYCLNLKKIEAVLFAKPQVHIAKNFKRGTCEYNAVLKHENKHIKVLKRAHREYLPHYRKHLRVTSKKVPVLPPMSLKEATQKKHVLMAQIKVDLNVYQNRIMQDVAERQKKVDTAEEYQRVNDRCKRWEKRLNE